MKLFALLIVVFVMMTNLTAQAAPPLAGVVVMHGKGGGPGKHVAELAASLERHGFLVANLEMPWSGRRKYDLDVCAAEAEVEAAFTSFRQKGVSKVFIVGHSQGGVFAFYFGGKHHVDGVVAIAPGGNVGSPFFRNKLAEPVELARRLVAEGKGDEKYRLSDYEGAKGIFPVVSAPAVYLTWFDPEGAMNQSLAMGSIKPDTPVLFIAPTNDYPDLVRTKHAMFGLLAKHPLTTLYEPNSTHLNGPTASAQKIEQWIDVVIKQ